ncbi:MAG: hypothetical protein KAT06_09305 [Gammaproteobacteria bacterium]|nr:hypothetical protein [Gammaproteobacteria bacterium]
MMYKKSIRLVGALSLTMMMSSCFYDPYYYSPPPYHAGGIYYPHDYYYYPNVGVYFHYSTGFYFYINNGIWIRSRILPPRFRLNVYNRVIIRSKSDKPYLQNKTHVEKYRPRPNLKPTPGADRYERESLRKTYKEQQYRKPPYNKKPQAEEKKEKREKDNRRR